MGDYTVTRDQYLESKAVQRKIMQDGTQALDADINEVGQICDQRTARHLWNLIERQNARFGTGWVITGGLGTDSLGKVTVSAGDAAIMVETDKARICNLATNTIVGSWTTPGGTRTDCLYLDITLPIIDSHTLPDRDVTLVNPAWGKETAVDQRLAFSFVKREGYSTPPTAPADHYYVSIALISRTASATITDGTITNLLHEYKMSPEATVNTAAIIDQAVTTAKIKDRNVTTGKIALLGVTGAEIATDAITVTKIAGGAVTAVKLATDAAIGNITADSLFGSKLATGASGNGITGDRINAATITGAKLANQTITATQIANLTVTAAQIANATITSTQIFDATITEAKLAVQFLRSSGTNNLTGNLALTAGVTIDGVDPSVISDIIYAQTLEATFGINDVITNWSAATAASAWTLADDGDHLYKAKLRKAYYKKANAKKLYVRFEAGMALTASDSYAGVTVQGLTQVVSPSLSTFNCPATWNGTFFDLVVDISSLATNADANVIVAMRGTNGTGTASISMRKVMIWTQVD